MALDKTTAPDGSGIKVSIDIYTDGSLTGTPVKIGHLDSFGSIIDKSRASKKYTPMNDTDYDEIVSLGSVTQAPFSMGVLYDPEATEGINLAEDAFDNNEKVQIIIELNNSKGANGTIYKQDCKLSSFKIDSEKDGKVMANISAEKIGKPIITPAAPVV